MPNTLLLLELILLPILIGLNAFFVAAEYAIVTVRSSRIEELESEGVPAAKVLARLKEDVGSCLATMQICITFTNLIIGAVAEPAVAHLLTAAFKWLFSSMHLSPVLISTLSIFIGLSVVTFFTVVLSELLPKALSLQYTDKIALWVARPVFVLDRIWSPVSWLMNVTAARVAKAFGLGQMDMEEQVHSEEELEILVDRAAEEGEFHEEHGELLRRGFDFADLNVRHIMIPLAQAAMVDSNMTVDELARRLGDRPFTRWPLRDTRTGNVNGIVSIKMVLYAVASAAGEAIILHDLSTPPQYLDPDLPLVDALTSMRKSRQHLCVVKDPTGPELGIITLEDILGAIAGELPKEARAPRRLPIFPPARPMAPSTSKPAAPPKGLPGWTGGGKTEPRPAGANPLIPLLPPTRQLPAQPNPGRQSEPQRPKGPTGGPA